MLKNPAFSAYLAANTPNGFFGYFDELQDETKTQRLFLIKGGPGTGKSTLMKRIAEAAAALGVGCERIYCSADPDSLDGLIFDGGRIAVVDGTPPHAMEPRYPGAFEEVIDLNALFDQEGLSKRKEEIISLSKENRALHKKTAGYLAAASALKREILRLSNPALQEAKVKEYAAHLAGKKKEATTGRLHRRFLTAIGKQGVVMKEGAFLGLEKRIGIEDRMGGASALLLKELKDRFLSLGETVYVYECPLAPGERIEHLVLPEKGIGFTTCNRVHRMENLPCDRTIHAERFYDQKRLEQVRQGIRFYEKAISSLVRAAASSEQEALANHDRLEEIYTPLVHFDSHPEFFDRAVARVLTCLV